MAENPQFNPLAYYPGTYKFNWDEGVEFKRPYGKGQIILKIIEANVIAGDVNGKSDPFVVIHVPRAVEDKEERKSLITSIKYTTLTPVWNETFKFDVEDVEDDLIILEIWDKDTVGSNDFLGFVTIDPSVLPYNREVRTVENLSYVDSGSLKIAITAINYGWEVESSDVDRYQQFRNNLVGSHEYFIEKEEDRIKKMDQYSKNRDQGAYVSKKGFTKRLNKKYSVVNGWTRINKSEMSEGLKTGVLIAGAVAGVLFEEAMKNSRGYRINYDYY